MNVLKKIIDFLKKEDTVEHKEIQIMMASRIADGRLLRESTEGIDIYKTVLIEETEEQYVFSIKYRKRFTSEILEKSIAVDKINKIKS